MDTEVPYMPSVTNLSKILDAIQRAGAPDAFGLDFSKIWVLQALTIALS